MGPERWVRRHNLIVRQALWLVITALRARATRLISAASQDRARDSSPDSEHSEHSVVVRSPVRDDLQHVPVLDDLVIAIEPEDVHPGVVVITGPGLVTVKDDEISPLHTCWQALAPVAQRRYLP